MGKVDEDLIKAVAETIVKLYKNDNKGEILIDGVEFYEDEGDWKRISFLYKLEEVDCPKDFTEKVMDKINDEGGK